MTQDWFKARAEIRVTEVVFKFGDPVFEVKGMIDFLGPGGMQHIASKEFSHTFFGFHPAVTEIRKLLTDKCGKDLFFEEDDD